MAKKTNSDWAADGRMMWAYGMDSTSMYVHCISYACDWCQVLYKIQRWKMPESGYWRRHKCVLKRQGLVVRLCALQSSNYKDAVGNYQQSKGCFFYLSASHLCNLPGSHNSALPCQLGRYKKPPSSPTSRQPKGLSASPLSLYPFLVVWCLYFPRSGDQHREKTSSRGINVKPPKSTYW